MRDRQREVGGEALGLHEIPIRIRLRTLGEQREHTEELMVDANRHRES